MVRASSQASTKLSPTCLPNVLPAPIMVTDGQVHDIPEQLTKLGFNAPVHGLLTGQRDERDRRIVIESAPRFGIVGKEQTIKFRVDDTAGGNGQASVTVRVGNADPITVTVRDRTIDRAAGDDRSWRPEHCRDCHRAA